MYQEKGNRGLTSVEDSDKTTRRLHKKEKRKTYYSDQKQYKQHKDQQNNKTRKQK